VNRSTFATLARHQIGSVVATAVDFGTMIALVSGFGVPAVAATAVGAACGGASNFALGRKWIFAANDSSASGQAVRYALVSLASLGWNALGEYVVHDRLGVQYVAARGLVAIAVSLAWNFPLQRGFVFRAGARDASATP
jgi:putative flippase GtrA